MQVLLAVVEDLYTFAVSMLFSWRESTKRLDRGLYLSESRVISPLRDTLELDAYHGTVSTAQTVAPDERAHNTLPQKHTVVYCARPQVLLRASRDGAIDTAIATVLYGDMIMVLEADDMYTYVAVGSKRGYMPTEALAQKAADVYPNFIIGAANGPHTTNTVRLRLLIRDEFGASLTQLSLQAHEYVYYKLLRRGTRIRWSDVRPRTPGAWASILGALTGVVMSDTPTVGSVMEYIETGGKAHLAYIEKVFPDQTIKISEADMPDRGIYNERTLTESTWHSLHPAFIVIT